MLTALVTLLVAIVPGALLGFVVPAGRDRWAVWASAPILTLGLTAVGMAWLPKLGLPDSVQWVLGAELVLALAAVAASRLLIRRHAPADRSSGSVPADARVAVGVGAAGGASAPPLDEPPPPAGAGATTDGSVRPGGSRRWGARLRASLAPVGLVDLVAVAIPAAVTVGFGQVLLGPLAEPPGWDALNHGVFTRNMIDAGSTAITSACTTGSTHPQLSCHFYPLAADVSWAQSSLLSGGHISTAMLAWSVLVGPLALVVGLYAAVRALGGRPVVAGCVALVPAVLSPMWAALLTGRPPEAFGPGLSVSLALLGALALRGKRPVRMGLLAGLGVAGLLMTHTYEILFAAVLALTFAFALRGRVRIRTVLSGLAAVAVGAVVAIGPLLGPLAGAGGERTSVKAAFVGQLGSALTYWIAEPQRYVLLGYAAPGVVAHHPLTVRIGLALTVPCLLASPLCFVFRQLRWARPWLVSWAVWTAIGIWTSTSDSAAAVFLAGLWYGIRERLRVMVLPILGVLAVAGACAIGLSLHWLLQRLLRRGEARTAVPPRFARSAVFAAAAAAVVLTAGLVSLSAAPSTRANLQKNLAERAPVGGSYPRVFRWLAQHTPKGDVVASDRHVEFVTWSYINDNVPLLFGFPPVVKASVADYAERYRAWNWLVNNPSAPPAGCLVRKYRIAYVVVGRVRMPGERVHYSRTRLAASPQVTLVHQDGPLKVYQVDAMGSACSTSA